MIDVDWFKRLNDRYGHPEGDECLRQVGTAIQTAIHRPRDLAARYGGEEFVVLLSETNEVSAGKVADHIQQAISRLAITHVDNPNGVVTVTAGVASTTPAPSKLLCSLWISRIALYRGKERGRIG